MNRSNVCSVRNSQYSEDNRKCIFPFAAGGLACPSNGSEDFITQKNYDTFNFLNRTPITLKDNNLRRSYSDPKKSTIGTPKRSKAIFSSPKNVLFIKRRNNDGVQNMPTQVTPKKNSFPVKPVRQTKQFSPLRRNLRSQQAFAMNYDNKLACKKTEVEKKQMKNKSDAKTTIAIRKDVVCPIDNCGTKIDFLYTWAHSNFFHSSHAWPHFDKYRPITVPDLKMKYNAVKVFIKDHNCYWLCLNNDAVNKKIEFALMNQYGNEPYTLHFKPINRLKEPDNKKKINNDFSGIVNRYKDLRVLFKMNRNCHVKHEVIKHFTDSNNKIQIKINFKEISF